MSEKDVFRLLGSDLIQFRGRDIIVIIVVMNIVMIDSILSSGEFFATNFI